MSRSEVTAPTMPEALFRQVVEAAPTGMILIDRAGKMVLVNAQVKEMFGFNRAELIGQPIEMLVPERFRGQHPEHRDSFFENPQARSMGAGRDLYGLRKDGGEVPVEIGLTPIRTETGLFVLAAIIDISQRKRAEEHLRLVVEAAPNGMIMIGADGTIVLANAQTEKLFGYAREELLGQPVEMLVPKRFRRRHPEHRTGFFAAPQVRSMGAGRDLYGLRKDGSEVPVEIGLNPMRTEAGPFVLAAIIDISHRKRAEEHFRLVVEAAPNGIIMIGADGKIVLVNAQTEKLFGYAREELLGQPVEMLVPERFRRRHPEHRTGFFAAPQVRSMGAGRDLYGLRKDGSEVPVEIGLNPMRTEARPFVLAAIIDISQRKRAEEHLRLVVEAAPNGMIMIGADGKIVLVNAQTEKLFGYAREELLGQPVEMLVPERFRRGHPEHRAGFFAAPQVRSMGAGRDLYGLRKDGSEVPVEIGLNPMQTEAGPFVLAAIIDISQRKRAEEHLRLVVEAAPNGIIMIEPSGTIVLVNAQTEKLFGYAKEELLGQPVEMLVPERFRRRHPEHRTGFFAAPQVRSMGAGRDLYGLRKDGSEVPVEIGLNPIHTEAGPFVLAAIIDITDRKRAEEALRQSEEHFRLMVEGVQDYAIVVLDPDGRIVSWNAGAERIKGYSAEEILGQSFARFYDAEEIAQGKPAQVLHVATAAGRCEAEGWRVRKDGSKFWANVIITSLKDATGHLKGFAKITRDVTERQQINEALHSARDELELRVQERTAELARVNDALQRENLQRREAAEALTRRSEELKAQQMAALNLAVEADEARKRAVRAEQVLRQSNTDLEQFAYVASHDLQEPLRMVASYLELLSQRYRGKLDDKADRWIDYAVDGAARMKQLINDLLEFSRVSTQGKPFEQSDCDRLFDAAVANLAAAIRESQAKVTRGPLPSLPVDGLQLTLLFQNLIGNAIKYRGPKPPEVHVQAVRDSSNWLFSVSDNGIGIEPQFQERIFVIFQRLHTRTEYPGTGIGLALCKKIVERHHGCIWVESRLGEGATFYFAIPDQTEVADGAK